MSLLIEPRMRQRVPRIASYLIHISRGGFVDVHGRDAMQTPARIDTVPKHAVKPRGEVVGKSGVVLPILNPWNQKKPR